MQMPKKEKIHNSCKASHSENRNRINRSSYMSSFMVAAMLAYSFAIVVAFLAHIFVGPTFFIGYGEVILVSITNILLLFYYINLAAKRFHDLDMSGSNVWWLLVPLINIVYGLILLLAPGTNGENRFGDMPTKTYVYFGKKRL